jgi:tetratricopeptide (TPR) repeat protein
MLRQSVLRLSLTLAVLLVSVFVSARQGASQGALSEREEVTAVDLVIELSQDGVTAAKPPVGLAPESFTVEEGGRNLTVVGVDVPPSTEPWRLLLYFDLELSSTASIRWAASALADRAMTLAELGEVEVVVADPDPRTVLAPTRDADLLDQTLSGIFLDRRGESEILSLREQFLIERQEAEELSAAEAVEVLVGEEIRLVGGMQDALLDILIEELPGTARRALLLVSDGFDEMPEVFYGRYGPVDQIAGRMKDSSQSWVKTIAAYGWSVIVVNVGAPEGTAGYGVVPTPDDRTLAVRTPGLTARLDGSMDPEKAAAHHELGQQLAEQGKPEAAATSLEEALRFYHDHPKYSRQRAAVLADLGEVLVSLGRLDEARRAIREAVELDSERASDHPFMEAQLEAPGAPLEALADSTGGRVVYSVEELSEAISGLARRIRLTFQFRGIPDGEIHQVVTQMRSGGYTVRAPSLVRFGTPATVSALRARRLLAGEVETGDFETKCRFVQESKSYSGRRGFLEVEILDGRPEQGRAARNLRLTIGIAREEGPFEIRQEDVILENETHRMPLEIADDDVWLSLVVDDPSSGRWGGATTEL